MKQNLAIAYAMKKKAQKKAHGGMIQDDEMKSGFVDHEGDDVKSNHMAMEEDDMDYNQKMAQGGELEGKNENISFSMDMPEDNHESHQHDSLHNSIKGDVVDRVMRKMYSEGGRVANDTPPDAEFEPNQFDDLVKDDHLESTQRDDGDNLGNAQEDEDRRDIVKRIMKQRSMKQRNPSPA